MWPSVKKYIRSEAGVILPMVALMFPVLLLVAALGVDFGFWMMAKRNLQTSADAAALAAVYEYSKGEQDVADLSAVALREAQSNGYTAGVGSSLTMAVLSPGRIRVDAEQPTRRFLSAILPGSAANMSVAAIAQQQTTTPPCVLALDDSSEAALLTKSNAQINMGCGVHSNSSHSLGLVTDSNSQINAAEICVNGGYLQKSNSSTSVPVEEGCPKLGDPYAGIAQPTVGACSYTNMEVQVPVNTIVTLDPGVYCGGLEVKSNSGVKFNPGTYIFKDGDLVLDSNVVAEGAGVTFYFTGALSQLEFKSNVNVTLSAPDSGPLAGVLFFQDPDYGGLHQFDSNVVGAISGLMYFPSGDWESKSNTQIGADNTCVQLVAKKITFDSNSGITGTPDMAGCPNYANNPVPSSKIRLVQ